MKKFIYTFISILAVFAIHSCGPNYNIDGTVASKSLEIAGQVIDIQGVPIPNVEVNVGGKTITTDDNGFFFTTTSSSSKTYFIKFKKDGYFPNIRSGKILSDEIKVKVALVPLSSVQFANLNTEVEDSLVITSSYGKDAVVKFPAGLKYVVSSTGERYTGNFTAYGFYVGATDDKQPFLSPGGSLWGIKNNEMKKIKPFAGLYILLVDENGRRINLADDNTEGAKLSLRIPNELLSSSIPDTINFWSDDFNKSFCYMSGSGSRDQDKYIAEVKHFSYWRAALDYSQTTTYTGTVTDCNGHPIPGVRVRINNVFSGVTNINGEYKIEAPKGLTEPNIKISLEDYAGIGYDTTIFAQVINDDIYSLDISLQCVQTITGRITDCDGNTVRSYVTFSYFNFQQGYNITTSAIAPRGLFRLYIPDYVTSGHLRIISQQGIYDQDIYNLAGDAVDNYNTYNICTQSQGSATITISGFQFGSGTTYDSLEYSTYFSTDYTDLFFHNNVFSLSMYFPSKVGSFQLDTTWTNFENGISAYGSFNFSNSSTYYNFYSGTLNITEFDTISGIVSGNFYGQAGNNDTTYTVSGSFDSIPLQQN